MAERRMFAKTIIDSDAFIDMPASARLLYYDLSMRADDDGFVNSPKKIIRMTGASQDDLCVLIAKQFVIPFESGVVVIRHWKIHNYIRKDTYNETQYKEEKALLQVDGNKAYKILDVGEQAVGKASVSVLDTDRPRAVDEPSTQVRLGKDRIDKDSINNTDRPQTVDEPSTHTEDGNIEGADAPVIEKTKKKPREEKLYYSLDEKLNQAILDFIAFRKTIKAPMTEKAIDLMISKLDGIAEDNNEKIKILEQSILNGWKGIFPLQKENKGNASEQQNGQRRNRFINYPQSDYDFDEIGRLEREQREKW